MKTAKKKRTKGYHPREIRQPMMATTRDNLALELRLAAEALILAPSVDTYNQLVLMTAALRTAGVTSAALDQATSALTHICDRFDRIKKVGISGPDAENLRAAVAQLDADLSQLSNNRFRAAVVMTNQQFKAAREQVAA